MTTQQIIWEQINPPPASGGGALVKIGQVVTAGSQATVTFSSIQSIYTDLLITYQGRDTTAGTSDSNIFLQLNGDNTAGNYDTNQGVVSTGSTLVNGTPASTANGQVAATLPNDGATAGAAGAGKIMIPNYAGTTWFKSVLGEGNSRDGTTPTNNLITRSFVWKSTAAITSLKFTAGTAFKDGSIFTLYGMG